MAVEIERKFLLADDSWRADVVASDHLCDGLIAQFGGGKVRVRLGADKAWLTIKGPRSGISRLELEYEIPLADAHDMLALCGGPHVEKMRHTVVYEGLRWSVDVHLGPLEGVVFAEVELGHPDQEVPLPPWVGTEVTDDPAYRKEALIRRMKRATP
jgi:CYTH domain-containing protein